MAAPSMVHRSGDTLIVRSVVSGDQLFLDDNATSPCSTPPGSPSPNETEPSLGMEEDKDLPQCKIKRNYTCTHCKYFTQNPRHFLTHLRDVHKEKVRIYECPSCLYASRHFQKLLRHMKMVHRSCDGVELPDFSRRRITRENEKRKRGQVIKKESEETVQDSEEPTVELEVPAEPEVVEPEQESEEESSTTAATAPLTKFRCSLCSYTTQNHSQLTKHERQEHIKTKFFRCAKCSYVTHIKARYTKHVKYHSMPMIKCELCDFRTPYKWNLDRHMKNHGGWGAFRCGACNFAADIKQSLTVHEMNHHVPPVGQAAGLGVGRRRNKVGGSDAVAAEEEIDRREEELLRLEREDSPSEEKNLKLLMDATLNNNNDTTIEAIKTKTCPAPKKHVLTNGAVHVDDAGYHNGRDAPVSEAPSIVPKKIPRPIPNLIPIQTPSSRRFSTVITPAAEMSQKDMNDICAKSQNSSLKDFASLVGAEEVMEVPSSFKKKNASFFDRLKEKLLINAGDSGSATCQHCGHVSNCLSEAATHQKTCKANEPRDMPFQHHNGSMLRSTRCQHCRHRCKSSADLVLHLATCSNAEMHNSTESQGASSEGSSNEKVEAPTDMEAESAIDDPQGPHPMENVVFVWNTLPPGRDEPEPLDRMQDEESSLDLSVRTVSPVEEGASESDFCVGVETAPGYGATLKTMPKEGSEHLAEKKVFKCPSCSFWATTASRFHVHIVGHLNRKPFECSLCSYRSNWRWDITKHIRLKSVRDKSHEEARVLMTDETGRRNYSKYNAYLTLMRVADGNDGSHSHSTNNNHGGRRSKAVENLSQGNVSPGREAAAFPDLQRSAQASVKSVSGGPTRSDLGELRPPPPLKATDDGKKKHFKCKKCHFRDPHRDIVLQHVKTHYIEAGAKIPGEPDMVNLTDQLNNPSRDGNQNHMMSWNALSLGENHEASVMQTGSVSLVSGGSGVGTSLSSPHGQLPPNAAPAAPFRCGHCHQVSNWKHVIQRHCRLKHNGDIRVHTADMDADEYQTQNKSETSKGEFGCEQCPFSAQSEAMLEQHSRQHVPNADSIFKCVFCEYYVVSKQDLLQHIALHGVQDPEEYFENRIARDNRASQSSVRFRCNSCPYVSNSKAQFSYHSLFHEGKSGEYRCDECTYSVSKRHLLQQHMRVHGRDPDIEHSPSKRPRLDDAEEDTVIEEVDAEPDKSLHFCDQCPARFLVEREWEIHTRYHGSNLSYKCEYCTYGARQTSHLQSHIVVHGSAYQDKTKQLQEMHSTSAFHPQPTTALIVNRTASDGAVWIAVTRATAEESDVESAISASRVPNKHFSCDRCPARFFKQSALQHHLTLHAGAGPFRCQYCDYSVRDLGNLRKHEQLHCGSAEAVPLSGTDLFAHKTEAQRAKSSERIVLRPNDHFPPVLQADPQFGTQIHGNPEFIYPTYVKNGRTREKRYKCHKCPSAFEKREQYRIHITLHGSKQRYKCEACDYSVKYYANYVQHMKKHQVNADAQAARRLQLRSLDDLNGETDFENEEKFAVKSFRPMSFADKQAQTIKTTRAAVKHRCSSCPFWASTAKLLEEHTANHGASGTNKCNHCDYVCTQNESLSDHERLHFQASEDITPEAYMNPSGLSLVCRSEENVDDGEEHVLYDDSCITPPPAIKDSEKIYVDWPQIMSGK